MIEKGFFEAEVSVWKVNQQAESVRIRENSSQCHKPTIAWIVCHSCGHHPTGEQVCYRRHAIQNTDVSEVLFQRDRYRDLGAFLMS
jgi:hypothetical protein